MTSRILIKNDESSPHAVIVHFSNDSATRLLKPGESVDATIYQGMCINLIESEEDYSHGEGEDPSGILAGTFQTPGSDETHSEIPLEFAPKEDEQS